MATLVDIAITPLVVFAVVSTMSQQHVPRIVASRQNVYFVVGITRLNLEVVNLTWILKKNYYRTLQRISQTKAPFLVDHLEWMPSNPRIKLVYTQHFPPLNQDPSSHTQDTNSSLNQNITAQLSLFINEFKALINPLISLLTTVIDKLINNANK